MAHLGDTVIFRAARNAFTETLKGKDRLRGSHFHPEMTEFAGIVGRVHADGSADLQILVPNQPTRWVDAVPEGHGPGTFSLQAAAPK